MGRASARAGADAELDENGARREAADAEPDQGTGRRKATDAEARALASALRMRILRVCLYDSHTNKEIASILGRDPASTLHHVRRLVATGFLAAQPARRGNRGSREIPYLATGKSWRMETPAKDRVLVEAFLEEMALVPAESMETARLGLRMDEQTRSAFLERLDALLNEFRVRSTAAPQGTAWSIFFAMHPDPNYPASTDQGANHPSPR